MMRLWLRCKRYLNHITFRERLLLGLMGVTITISGWYFFICTPQLSHLTALKKEQQLVQEQTTLYNSERSRIEGDAKAPEMKALISQYESIIQERMTLSQKIQTYQHRFVSEKDMLKMLKAMILELKSVELEALSTQLSSPQDEARDASARLKKQYFHLDVTGTYQGVYALLQSLEKLDWQLYWESFEYSVEEYPKASVHIVFYTLGVTHDALS